MATRKSVQVGIKVRPLRRGADLPSHCTVVENTISLNGSQSDPYCFDHVFDHETSNQMIFDKMARHIIHSTVHGFNGTIFAYGQTASGKTYTMMGEKNDPGVMVLAAKEVFDEIERTSGNSKFLLRGGFIEIYNEKVYDLLNKSSPELKIHESANGNAQVNCQEVIINNEEQLLEVLEIGNRARTVSETNMNERSSRSHAIFRLIIESGPENSEEDVQVTQSILQLVDLAGSERADQTGARGARLKEGGHINKSLLFLSTVIQRLSENDEANKFISYRDSKLTRILQASLGGNAFTSIICTINPSFIEETQSTLNFAMRAKTIKNRPQVNEIVSEATMMKRLNREIAILKQQLHEEKRKNASQMKLAQIEHLLDCKQLNFVNSSRFQTSHNKLVVNRRRTWCAQSTDLPSDTSIVDTILPSPNVIVPPPSRLKPPNSSVYFTPQITLRDPVAEHEKTKRTEMSIVEENFEPAENFNFGDYQSSLKMPGKTTTKTNDDNGFQKINDSPIKLDLNQHVRMLEEQLESLQEFTSLEENASYEQNKLLEQERIEYLVTKNELDLMKERFLCSQKRSDGLQTEIDKLTIAKQASERKVEQYEAELLQLKAKLNTIEVENQNAVGIQFEFETYRNKSKQREKELLEVLDEKDVKISGFEKQFKALHAEIRLKDSCESAEGQNGNNANLKVCTKCEEFQCLLLDERKRAELEFGQVSKKYEELEINYQKICREVEVSENQLHMLQNKYDTLEANWKKQEEAIVSINSDYNSLEKQYNELRRIYDSLEYSSNKSTAECARLQCENDVLQVQIQNLKKRLENMQEQLLDGLLVISKQEDEDEEEEEPDPKETDLRCENERLKIQSNELETQYAQLQQDYEQLSTNVMESVDENEKLLRTIKNLEDELKASEAKRIASCLSSQSERVKLKDNDLSDDDDDDDDTYESNQVVPHLEHVEIIEFESRAYIPINASVKSKDFVVPYKLSLGQWKNTRNSSIKGQLKATIEMWKEPHEDFEAINKGTIQYLNETIENLENLVESLKAKNDALFESSQRDIRELREEIQLLTAELMEKSVVLEDLVKERAEISLLNEELQIKVAMSRNNSMNNNDTSSCECGAAYSSINETICQLPSIREHTIEKAAGISFDDTALNTIKTELMEKDKECNRLKLEMLQNLQLAESEFRSHLRKYNAEWEESHRKYKQRIKELEEILLEKGITIKTELQEEDHKNVPRVNSSEEYEENYAAFRRDDKTSTPTTPTKHLKEAERARLERSAMVQECNDQLSKLHIAIEESKNVNVQLNVRLTEKEEQLQQKQDEIECLKLQIVDTERCSEEFKMKNEKSERSILNLEQRIEILEMLNATRDNEILDLKAQRQEAERKQIKLEEQYGNELSEKEMLIRRKAELEADLRAYQDELNEQQRLQDDIQKELKQLKIQYKDLEGAHDRLETCMHELDEQKKARVQLESRLDDVLSQNQTLHAELAEQKKARVQLESRLDDELSQNQTLHAELAEQKKARVQLESRLDDVLSQNQTLHAELAEQKKARLQLESRLDDELSQNQTLHAELAEQKKARVQLESRLDDELSQNQTLHAELAEQKKARVQLESRLDDELSQNQTLHAELAEQNKARVQLESRLDDVLNQNRTLHAELAEQNKARVQLESRLDDVGNQNQTLHAELAKCKKCKQDLKSKVEAFQQKVKMNESLESEVERLRKEQRESQETIDKMQKQINSLVELEGERSRLQAQKAKAEKKIVENKEALGTSETCHLKTPTTVNTEDKSLLVQKERRHRRLSTHDENRRQSAKLQFPVDASTSTDAGPGCECDELRTKLSECETQLYIRQSQVTALHLELRNHPLKAEKVQLVKRIQEEQEKSRVEIKKLKTKISEQAAKIQANIATLPLHVVTVDRSTCMSPRTNPPDVATQTDMDIDQSLQKLQGKYNDLKRICRFRYTRINDLEKLLEEKENFSNCHGTTANQQNAQTSTTDKSSHKGSSERHKPKQEDSK